MRGRGSHPASRDAPRVVLHAVYSFGLASETFIRDAIAEAEALGWMPWVVTESLVGHARGVPLDRIALPRRWALVDRVGYRVATARGLARDREASARNYLAALSRLPRGVLHAHFGWTAADCTLAARKLGLPLVVSFHGTDLTVSAQEPAWRRYYTEALARADSVTVVSRFLERRLRQFGFDGPVEMVPSGVRLDQFPFSGGPHSGRVPRLLFVGRLIECKGLDVLLGAMAQLSRREPGATLRVVGDGPLGEELQASAHAQGLEGVVRFLGSRTHREVRHELEESDIVVVPSRALADGQEEGSSVVSKEAQAIGIPVVATDVGGIPETLPPELRHELVPQGDLHALAARIAHVWDERADWPARVRLQREWVASEFAWDRIAPRLSRIYESAMARHPPARAALARALRRSGRRARPRG
jgi:colanic acid/amylovoran biosynthesis glycosyltransferase